jgi:hypothetical protein
VVSISPRSDELSSEFHNFKPLDLKPYLQMHLQAERFGFSGWCLEFPERWSQDISNGTNVASELVNFFTSLHICSLCLRLGYHPFLHQVVPVESIRFESLHTETPRAFRHSAYLVERGNILKGGLSSCKPPCKASSSLELCTPLPHVSSRILVRVPALRAVVLNSAWSYVHAFETH